MKRLNLILTAATALALISGCSKKAMQNQVENGTPGLNALNIRSSLPSAPGDVVGKVTVGYQGWFSATGDGSPLPWDHTNMEQWPDIRQYPTTYSGDPFFQAGTKQAAYTGNLGNGLPAKMYSSYDQQVCNIHCLWMQQNGIDCIALQRFSSTLANANNKAFHDSKNMKMMNAAQTYGRKFYIMYDCGTADSTRMKDDWTNYIVGTQHLTSSSAYARQNGKPVVCIWGVGKALRGTAAEWVKIINWFKAQGCYFIGGPGHNFSTDTANFSAYNACDMIMPWQVGYPASHDFQSGYAADLVYCNAHGIDYQANIYPGGGFFNSNGQAASKNDRPRNHGDFMWQQFTSAKNAGAQSVYIAMFDEMNEGTAILNCAEDASSIPAGKYFLTLDADGTHVSSDFYLRLTLDGSRLIKGTIPYTATHPTPHVLTPTSSLTPHVQSSSAIQINWAGVTDCPCYNVKRSTVSGGPYTTVAAGITGGTYTNTGLAANTTYYYVITSGRIDAGESVISRQVSAKTNP